MLEALTQWTVKFIQLEKPFFADPVTLESLKFKNFFVWHVSMVPEVKKISIFQVLLMFLAPYICEK